MLLFFSGKYIPFVVACNESESAAMGGIGLGIVKGDQYRHETRSRNDGVAEVNLDLTLEELPEMGVERSLLVEAHAIGDGVFLVGLANNFVDRTLARLDGFDLLLQDAALGRVFPSLDETVRFRLASEGVGRVTGNGDAERLEVQDGAD